MKERPAFSRAPKNAAESIELVEQRQKLIRMADTSELGWRIGEEYKANPLAVDSEDTKNFCTEPKPEP